MKLRTALFVALAVPSFVLGCAANEEDAAADVDGAEDELTTSQLAGAFQHWHPGKTDGEISQLHLDAPAART